MGRDRKMRAGKFAEDGNGDLFEYIFCPRSHPIASRAGYYDRLVLGILGDAEMVGRFVAEMQAQLITRSNPALFAYPAVRDEAATCHSGKLLTLHPVNNSFPLHLWILELDQLELDQVGERLTNACKISRFVDGIIILVDASDSSQKIGRSVALRTSIGPSDRLTRFWESISPAGDKIPVSLAVVLTGCDRLIDSNSLPRNIGWNLATGPGTYFDALVQCDTSARFGELIAKHLPALYHAAQNRFRESAFFGVGEISTNKPATRMYRALDPLLWMLAQRNQIPKLPTTAAFERLSGMKDHHFIFG
ncbi:MAG: hypothetical protein JNL18_18615 [Planctomycetaceae bacterium]|nr:hypothetical protein [Planctomycetaceae bacterium]